MRNKAFLPAPRLPQCFHVLTHTVALEHGAMLRCCIAGAFQTASPRIAWLKCHMHMAIRSKRGLSKDSATASSLTHPCTQMEYKGILNRCLWLIKAILISIISNLSNVHIWDPWPQQESKYKRAQYEYLFHFSILGYHRSASIETASGMWLGWRGHNALRKCGFYHAPTHAETLGRKMHWPAPSHLRSGRYIYRFAVGLMAV